MRKDDSGITGIFEIFFQILVLAKSLVCCCGHQQSPSTKVVPSTLTDTDLQRWNGAVNSVLAKPPDQKSLQPKFFT